MESEDDRRKRTRVPVQSKIRHSQYQVLGTPVFQENSSIDISSGGISFETAREYQMGNLVLLEVEANGELLKLLVCVARVVPSQSPELFEVGAELIAVDPADKRKMQKHLDSILDTFHKTKIVKKTGKKAAKKPASKKSSKKSASKKAGPKKAKATAKPKRKLAPKKAKKTGAKKKTSRKKK